MILNKLLIISIIIGGIAFLLLLFSFLSNQGTDGGGKSPFRSSCVGDSDCAFYERVDVPVPGNEGCYPKKDLQNSRISTRLECECLNNRCKIK
ncbi:MAG: hypothetical protein AABX51_02185 [Nanoarchaeota archaeon]